MSELSIILADETTVSVDQVALPLSITKLCDDMATMLEVWQTLADVDKTATLEVVDGDTVVSTFGGVTLAGTQVVYNDDGSMTAHFYMEYTESGDEVSADAAIEEIVEAINDDEE